MNSDDPFEKQDTPQTRKRSNAIFEPPSGANTAGPKRGQHEQKMSPGVDAKHSQMQGPKPMSELLAQHLSFTKGQQKHIMGEVGRINQNIEQKRKHGFKADDPDVKRATHLMDQHSKLLGLGGKEAKEGMQQLRNAQDALKSAEEMRSAFKPFFDKPGEEGTEAQRKQAGEAMKSMVGALKQFGPKDHLKVNSRTKIDPKSGEEIADSPAADAMRAFTQSLIKNKDMLKGIVPDKAGQEAAKNAIGVKVSEGKDGQKTINLSMQAPQQKNPMQGMNALMNLGKLGAQAMSSEALGGKNMATQMQGLGNLFKTAQRMNLFTGMSTAMQQRKQPKLELNIHTKPKQPEAPKPEANKSSSSAKSSGE